MLGSKGARIGGYVLSGLIAALLLFSAAAKFSGGAQVVEGFTKFGLKDQILLIGVGELVSTILFLVPVTLPLGTVLLSSYMGGAILAHMSHGEAYVTQSIVLVLIWVAAWLRRPQMFLDRPARAVAA
jgi:DoxX-like family